MAKEISKYKLHLAGVQIKWDRVAPNQQVNIHCVIERGMRIMN
jgi:hypothetical protein